jgi:hypothetical protein
LSLDVCAVLVLLLPSAIPLIQTDTPEPDLIQPYNLRFAREYLLVKRDRHCQFPDQTRWVLRLTSLITQRLCPAGLHGDYDGLTSNFLARPEGSSAPFNE